MALSGEMLILHPVIIFFRESFQAGPEIVVLQDIVRKIFLISNSVNLILGLFMCEILERKID